MPVRRSEAYDDPLRQQSVKAHDNVVLPHKIEQEKFVEVEEAHIEWSNLIFLPFHSVFRIFVLVAVFIKAVLGPIQSVYPIIYCNYAMDHNPILILIKYFYGYLCDSLYGIDTFLHVVHRQVTDKAMRREHLPKSAKLLICDIISLIPFFRLMVSEPCPPAKLWPNILAFNEFIIIYRVTQYFQLISTHSYAKLIIGYTIVLGVCLNCVTCFWLLLTEEGFCARCKEPGTYYDWRAYMMDKINHTDSGYNTYVHAFLFVYSFTGNLFYDNQTIPSAILEFGMICLFLIAGYFLRYFIILPKTFAEAMLRLRSVCQKYPIVCKVIDDTNRRSYTKNAAKDVQNYYKIIWRKQGGVIKLPKIYTEEIPRYLRLEINQDLLWPLYYHSPILRKSSYPFRRWVSETVSISYRFPGDKFYTGSLSSGNLYYLKSGVVELISADDGSTPILSVTSGTVFGDINFYVPHLKRKVMVRCLTYCEIYYLQRKCFIQALHKYPADRKIIMQLARERLQHAKTLHSCKTYIRGIDRNEDEGIAWIKRRWWQIYEIVHVNPKKIGKSKEEIKLELPSEEAIYHCSKYIGQLVLCTPAELETNSMFTQFHFPWILNPYSKFGYVWHKIVNFTVILVLCIYPPNLIRLVIPNWFLFFSYCCDTIFALDICVSLLTAVKTQDSIATTFATVMFERCKSLTFILDVFSTLWIESLASLVGCSDYYYTFQFNRLIKVYKLFYGPYIKMDIRKNPFLEVTRKIALIHFAYTAIVSHSVFELASHVKAIRPAYFFGKTFCSKSVTVNCMPTHAFLGVNIEWIFEWTYSEYWAHSLEDVYVGVSLAYINFLVVVYSRACVVAYLYLRNWDLMNYQRFVLTLKAFYAHYRIHTDLLHRLDRYLICHWKYYKGYDVMHSNALKTEPIEVFWKAQGEVAESVIKESKAFKHADPLLIRELTCAAKYLLVPRNASIFIFGHHCKNVVWIVQGCVKSEYYNEEGELLSLFHERGAMLAVSSILLGKVSLRSYTTYTDCEILYIETDEFLGILKRYSIEYSYLENCRKEFSSSFDEIFKKVVLKHKDYQTILRDRIYSTRMSRASSSRVPPGKQENRSLPFEGELWGDPESRFMQTWLLFRAIIAYVSITTSALLGGVGAVSRWTFAIIRGFCNCIAWIDIILKLFLAYYDHRGIKITDRRKCLMNYLSKAFILDVIGSFPFYQIVQVLISTEINDDDTFLMNTLCKFAHIYILFAYFDYISDLPTVNITLITIVKWQLVNILIILATSHYFMVKCVDFTFNQEMELVSAKRLNSCWMPDLTDLPEDLKWEHVHLIFAQSLNLAECGLLRMNFGRFLIDRQNMGVGAILFLLGLLFWFITCYILTLLVLGSRGDNLFQHSVHQLKAFLESERVENSIIEKVMSHFRYCWLRTKGIDIQQLTNERIGVMFREDLSYYFYKTTFTILDSIIKCGEPIQRQLASASTQVFFLPGQDIVRQMDLLTNICIVHRGKVSINQDGRKLVVLTKGDCFGQLLGTTIRPIRITAKAEEMVDLLYISVKDFQRIITEEVRTNIIRYPQYKFDYLATKTVFIENPYDTVKYLIRGRKAIQLRKNFPPTEARQDTWYSIALHVTWLIGPFVSAVLVLLFLILPPDSVLWFRFYIVLICLDFVHVLHFISEFYAVELVVRHNKCIPKRIGKNKFKEWSTYLDIISLLVPLITLVTNEWRYQLIRLVRLKWFFDFEAQFCRSFKSRVSPFILKFSVFALLMHLFTCGWICVACRDETFPFLPVVDIHEWNETIDFSEWTKPEIRKSGCGRATRDLVTETGREIPHFVVPKLWQNDYIIAFTYILLILTQTPMNTVIAMSLPQAYYKVVVTFVLYLVDIFIMAMAINTAYTRYREMYQYDYRVNKILTYLKCCGLSQSICHTFRHYTHLLWRRHKGDKLPELAYEAPPCLRQDIFGALYMHHLEAPPTFRQLPDYFKRQLVARLQRIVIFPGKCIVREGDTFNITYFIHEGEVEKWYYDAHGESKLLSVLYTNGYFGCISGLFINLGFQFSYYSRTVVDLVVLSLHKWQDLLDGYPEVKRSLYASTRVMKKDSQKYRESLVKQSKAALRLTEVDLNVEKYFLKVEIYGTFITL